MNVGKGLICGFSAAVAIGLSTVTWADTNAAPKSSAATKAGMLTDKEISELQTELTSDKNGQKIVFYSDFHSVKPKTAYEQKKYAKSSAIPIRVTCSLEDVKEINGRQLGKRLSGTARICIMDADGNVVDKQSVSLDKMCPS